MQPHLLITGEPGVGKTTLLRRVLAEFNKQFVGFVTTEIRESDRRVGFMVKNLATGGGAILAHVQPSGKAKQPMVSRYYVLTDTVPNMLCPVILGAVKNNQPLVMDEIGQMQLLSGEVFTSAVLAAFERNISTIATVHLKEHPFTDVLKQRPDVRLLHVTHENRDRLTEDLSQFIRERF